MLAGQAQQLCVAAHSCLTSSGADVPRARIQDRWQHLQRTLRQLQLLHRSARWRPAEWCLRRRPRVRTIGAHKQRHRAWQGRRQAHTNALEGRHWLRCSQLGRRQKRRRLGAGSTTVKLKVQERRAQHALRTWSTHAGCATACGATARASALASSEARVVGDVSRRSALPKVWRFRQFSAAHSQDAPARSIAAKSVTEAAAACSLRWMHSRLASCAA